MVVRAILVSDIHLSHKPPAFRSAEPDWYEAMARPLNELRKLSEVHQCPIICAGDVFDDGWRPHRCPPELINFALEHLPQMYAVPGQHDLPHHRYEDIERSAYWTMVHAETIINIDWHSPAKTTAAVILHGFPWGSQIKPLNIEDSEWKHLAVVHSFLYSNKGNSYPGAPESGNISQMRSKLKGFDFAVFGDNHKGFISDVDIPIMNCGTFFIRKSDERHYKPMVGLLSDDGIKPHYLDISEDKYLEESIIDSNDMEMNTEDFLRELENLGSDSLDFRDAVLEFMRMENTDESVKKYVLQSMG